MFNISKRVILISVLAVFFLLTACKDFLNPKQELEITREELFDDWYDYRAVEMGLYGLQQQLVDQIIILGELRGDMMDVTLNADADLIAIYNFNYTKDNKYISPLNFMKLISACNNFMHVLQTEHPEVLNPKSPVNNYDRLYGEALCMRAWAYFNAVLIYGKVPYIPESLVTLEEIQNFVNSDGTYIDSVYINFGIDGYHNKDTVYNKPIVLEKQLMDMEVVLDRYIYQLENDVKYVGVNHYMNNLDNTWEITIWNMWAYHALLGKMYMYQGDIANAVSHLEKIIYNSTDNYRYQLDGTYSGGNWKNIFTTLNTTEQLLTVYFNDDDYQNNHLQDFFESRAPHFYMLKPSAAAISLIEGSNDTNRGLGVTYAYIKGGNYSDQLSWAKVQEAKNLRARRDYVSANNITEGYDTVLYKYSLGKDTYDNDALYIIYRAAEIHLDLAEIYTYWSFTSIPGTTGTFVQNALNILNNGNNYVGASGARPQKGVRGRVGLSAISLSSLPNNNLAAKQNYLDQRIQEERGRELAFEGKRFYDLMRAAKRMNNPSFLASKVSAKYPLSQRTKIRNYLMNENNWYIHYFD